MTTTPLSQDFVNRLAGATAWRFSSNLGPVFTPRFFCCDDPNDLGITDGKQPVAVLDLTPNPAFPNDTINFDGTDSYDPDGSIMAFAFTFASGTPSSSSASSGTVTWASPGEYEVKLVVTDGTGLKSSPARVTMVVLEPQNSYYIGTSTGVYFTDDGGQTWTARNIGLSGDSLVVNDLKIDPATQQLVQGSKTLWIATDGGLYISNDGAANWTQKNPASVSNAYSDSPAPTVSALDFTSLLFSGSRLFAIANWQNGAGDERGWLFYTDDTEAIRTDTGATVSWSEL